MSKLKQLLSYLSRPEAKELVFKAGSPTVLKTAGRDLPVIVTALGLGGIRRFFDGTPVAEKLGREGGTHDTDLELDGQTYVCTSVSQSGKLEVRVKLKPAGSSARDATPARAGRYSSTAVPRARMVIKERVSVGDGRSRDEPPAARTSKTDSTRMRIREEPAPGRDPRSDAGSYGTRDDSPVGSRSGSPSFRARDDAAPSNVSRSEPSSFRARDDAAASRVSRSESSSFRARDDAAPSNVSRSESSSFRARDEPPPVREEPPPPPTPPPAASPPEPFDERAAQAPAPPRRPMSAEERPLGYELVAARPSRPATPRIDTMLRTMIEQGASDLHLSSGTRPMLRLHGKMQPLPGYPELSARELSSLLLEIIDDRAYEDFVANADADFAHAVEGLARFRANYFADRHGMGAVFRQIPMEILTPEKLGLPSQVTDLCWLSKGLVLVTGPTGSGKSTTLAALIDFINRNRDDHIITIEDPIEFVHENKRCLINQREVGRHTRSFKAALRAALREDPDVILVGELRDLETVAIALETAETGHLVFGTLHTTTAPSTVDRIIDQFPGDQQSQIRTMLGESLRGVIGQTLLRRKTGGRVAAYEILLHTSAVGNLIREGKTHQLKNTMQVSKNAGMQNLNDHLLRLVMDDIVDAQEAYVKAVDKQTLREMFKKAAIHVELPKDD